jgi:hypothetical protein
VLLSTVCVTISGGSDGSLAALQAGANLFGLCGCMGDPGGVDGGDVGVLLFTVCSDLRGFPVLEKPCSLEAAATMALLFCVCHDQFCHGSSWLRHVVQADICARA